MIQTATEVTDASPLKGEEDAPDPTVDELVERVAAAARAYFEQPGWAGMPRENRDALVEALNGGLPWRGGSMFHALDDDNLYLEINKGLEDFKAQGEITEDGAFVVVGQEAEGPFIMRHPTLAGAFLTVSNSSGAECHIFEVKRLIDYEDARREVGELNIFGGDETEDFKPGLT